MMATINLFISWILLSYIVSTYTLLDRRELKANGYDCGDAFFNDFKVYDELKTALLRERGKILPYFGPLYSSAMNYYTWPILPIGLLPESTKFLWQRSTYQIVFDENGKVIDIIVRLANYQFAKCWRVDIQRLEALIYSMEGSNGYECGPNFIPDDTIKECTSLAVENLDKGYKIWPIYYRDLKIHRYPNTPTGTFFIVIDSAGQLRDVIARISTRNYIRCMRAREVPEASENDELSQVSAKTPKKGYLCHDVFFDDNDLLLASRSAQRIDVGKRKNGYPKNYYGPPFKSPCLLWPIKKNGESYRAGRLYKYRLVLTLDFKVLSVVMVGDKELVPCDRRVASDDHPVRNSYRCHSDVFSPEEVAVAAKTACRYSKRAKKQAYPAPYQGLEFDVKGPYLIYPLKKNKFSNVLGNHRVVIDLLCQIGGVLTVDPRTNEYVKELKENGYDCGDAFFDDKIVNDILRTALSEEGRKKSLPYSGPLYNRAMNYKTWPLFPTGSLSGSTKLLWQRAIYQIVFDENGRVIDIIVRMTNTQFAKCWRVDTQRSEASIYSVEGSNGYECGSEFIPDSTIEECTSLAVENLDKGYYYPLEYKGNLYSEDQGYKIWPIYYATLVIHRYPKTPRSGSFFIVIDSAGQLRDVIARTSKKNYIRCMRARKVSPAPDTDELSQIFAKPSRLGYLCHDVFFDDIVLDLARQVAQRSQLTRRPVNFPKSYDGPPFDIACFLWPLKKNGESYATGRMDIYRLVLTLNFEVLTVAMVSDKELVPCERRVAAGGYQVRNSYRCQSDVFSYEELASTAEIACRKRKQSQRQTYPAPYQGLKFDIEGPYLIFPIKKDKSFPKPGNHRLVINYMCHIAGVLTMHPFTHQM
ncbi:hypothetical protein EPUL_005618, partial [Erysiphe pulchra]